MTGATGLVSLTVREPVAIVRLERSSRRNTPTGEMLADLRAALDEAESRPDCRAIVVTGSGRAFCADADLRQLLALLDNGSGGGVVVRPARPGRSSAGWRPPLCRWSPRSMATVAGSFELVLATDVVVAAEGALLGDEHLRSACCPMVAARSGWAARSQPTSPAVCC